MSSDIDAICNAARGKGRPDRRTHHKGSRERALGHPSRHTSRFGPEAPAGQFLLVPVVAKCSVKGAFRPPGRGFQDLEMEGSKMAKSLDALVFMHPRTNWRWLCRHGPTRVEWPTEENVRQFDLGTVAVPAVDSQAGSRRRASSLVAAAGVGQG